MEKQTWTPRRIFEHDGAQTEPAGSGSRPHWAAGSFALLVRWVGRWALTHELVKGSTVCDTAVDLDSPIPVRCTNALAEPGVMPWLDRPLFNVELRAPANRPIGHRELVAELLKEQFNLELIVHPMARPQQSAGLDF